MKDLDTQIQQQNEKALTHYMQQYFTKDQLSEMLQQYTTYEIKVNGEKITASNINYNSGKSEVEIEVSAQFNDRIYPKELFDENCPLRIYPDGNEISEIISLHTTNAKYTFESENSVKNHTYRYKITQLAPGEVVTLKINEPRIRAALDPAITKLEVTRSR